VPWPAPALLTWLAAWALLQSLVGASPALAWCAALALGPAVALALRHAPVWRRLIVAAGFPVSVALKGLASLATAWAAGSAQAMPAWAWLLPAAMLLAAYPLRAWRDAPMFPTPPRALQGLAALTALPAGASLLDAGCGLGHGLAALRAEYPAARIAGVEWSWPLCLVAAARCRWARVRRGDMWRADWSGLALVYLFQRPESMARALTKAEAEMAPGSWLVSLEFAVPGCEPTAVLRRTGAKPVWLYRVDAQLTAATAAQSARLPADNPLNKPAHPGRR
jgi:SAM-dependent methyltransferase